MYMSRQTSTGYADPFSDASEQARPTNIRDALYWIDRIILGGNGAYATALHRAVSYFVTDIEFIGDDGDTVDKRKYQEYLEQIGINSKISDIGFDVIAYGNSFFGVNRLIHRWLMCPKCKSSFTFAHLRERRRVTCRGIRFSAKCPKCDHSGDWGKPIDMYMPSDNDIVIQRFSPHLMHLKYNSICQKARYFWDIDRDIRSGIQRGDLDMYEFTPLEVIEAITSKGAFAFEDGYLCHLREEAPASMEDSGWGVSRVLSNFRQAWLLQVLTRQNEAMAMEQVNPFRVITPEPRSGADNPTTSDLAHTGNFAQFTAFAKRMVALRRFDPNAIHVSPYAIKYQIFGADATRLVPKDMLEQAYDWLLSSADIPVDLYKGSLQIQVAPVALRLFQAAWSRLPYMLNRALNFILQWISYYKKWQPIKARFRPVVFADDIQAQMAKLQLAQAKMIAPDTALQTLGLSSEEEFRKLMQDELMRARETQKFQERIEREGQGAMMMAPPALGQDPAAQGGAPPADPAAAGGAAPPAGGVSPAGMSFATANPNPNAPRSVDDVTSMAEQEATRLYPMSNAQRRQELKTIKQKDETLHSLVTSILDDLGQEAASAGRQQGREQAQGQQPQQ